MAHNLYLLIIKSSNYGTDRLLYLEPQAVAQVAKKIHVMGKLESLKVDRAVLVTHHPANDYVFHTELNLNRNDVEIVRENFRLLGYSSNESDWKNLWHGVIQIARKVK